MPYRDFFLCRQCEIQPVRALGCSQQRHLTISAATTPDGVETAPYSGGDRKMQNEEPAARTTTRIQQPQYIIRITTIYLLTYEMH